MGRSSFLGCESPKLFADPPRGYCARIGPSHLILCGAPRGKGGSSTSLDRFFQRDHHRGKAHPRSLESLSLGDPSYTPTVTYWRKLLKDARPSTNASPLTARGTTSEAPARRVEDANRNRRRLWRWRRPHRRRRLCGPALPASDLLSASFVMVTTSSDTLVQHSAV